MSSTDNDCHICGESFESEQALNEHMAEERPEHEMTRTPSVFPSMPVRSA
ncbi:C2H2-type zinc finger protein [Halococcus sp. AFM35]